MKVHITGSEGFIGRWVRERMEQRHEVFGFDCLTSVVHGDDPPRPDRTFVKRVSEMRGTDFDCDVLIHLAALVSVADSMVHPHKYFQYNTTDTLLMLQRLAETPYRPKIVVASSSSVYGNVDHAFMEDGPTDPCNVYGLTKLDQEKLVRMWGDMLRVPTVSLRFFNVYGPGQAMRNRFTGVMANFARDILAGRQPEVTQDGQQIRDFVYVEDVAAAVEWAALHETRRDIYNVCTGIPTTMDDATRWLASALGHPEIEPNITGRYRHGDQDDVVGDPGYLYTDFANWSPRSVARGMEQYGAALQ